MLDLRFDPLAIQTLHHKLVWLVAKALDFLFNLFHSLEFVYQLIVLSELVIVQQVLLFEDHICKLTVCHLLIESVNLSDGMLALHTLHKARLDLLDNIFELLLVFALCFDFSIHLDLELSCNSSCFGLNFEPFFFWT